MAQNHTFFLASFILVLFRYVNVDAVHVELVSTLEGLSLSEFTFLLLVLVFVDIYC